MPLLSPRQEHFTVLSLDRFARGFCYQIYLINRRNLTKTLLNFEAYVEWLPLDASLESAQETITVEQR